MPNESRDLPATDDGLTRFLGGSPLAVAVRLILMSLLVGVVLAAIGFDPWNIIHSHPRAVPAGLGSRLRRHQRAVALLPARRRDRDPDLAVVAAVRRAARTDRARSPRDRLAASRSRATSRQVFAIAGPAMIGQSHHADARPGRHRGDRPARRRHAARRRGDGLDRVRLPVLAVRLPAHEHGGVRGAGASAPATIDRTARGAAARLCCGGADRRCC